MRIKLNEVHYKYCDWKIDRKMSFLALKVQKLNIFRTIGDAYKCEIH